MRYRALWAVVVLVALLVGCASDSPVSRPDTAINRGSSSHQKGAKEATEAVAAGLLKIKEYPPLPSPAGHGVYVALLREQCGVGYEVPHLMPGVAEADLIQEVRGWNEVMQAAIKKKYGASIFEELRLEASKRWEERVKPEGKR